MKKIDLFVAESHKMRVLAKLRDIGTVHVQNLTVPVADDLKEVEAGILKTGEAINFLKNYEVKEPAKKSEWVLEDMPGIIDNIIELKREKQEAIKDIQELDSAMEWYEPWGAFKVEDLELFEKKGIKVTFYRTSKRRKKEVLQHEGVYIIREKEGNIYFAGIGDKREDALNFEEITPPKKSFETLYEKKEGLNRRIIEIDGYLHDKARIADMLKDYLALLAGKQTFLNVKFGMHDEKEFACLEGYCPADKVGKILELSKELEFGYTIKDPGPDDNPPTLITNPKWISIIEPIFSFMNTVPGYKEFDISMWFLIFFSVFFAMLIGDAGYGVLFAGLTFIAHRKLKNIPKQPFFLMYLLSATTFIWGAVTGTWFGSEAIARLPFFDALIIQRVNSFVETNQNFMIYICFVIGAIQLSIARILRAVRTINSPKAVAEIGWVFVLWGLFFVAGTLVIGRPFPQFAKYLFVAGVLLLIFFMNPQRNVFKGALMSIADLPLKIVASFSDVVSYLRLFAVGYASVVLSSSFNEMGLQIGFGSILASLGAAMVMFLGHALNIVLGLMAVIVHGVRLNMLEFSGQMGIEWAGHKYEPFKKTGK